MEPRRSGKRWVRLFLVFGTVVISFTDRSNLALVAPRLAADLKLGPVEMGLVFSAFGWAYVAGQLPGGWIVDRLAPRFLYPIMMGAWSLLTVGLGMVSGTAALFGLRLGIGGCEAPVFPANNQVVTTWFPERQRARAIGFYASGQFVGLALISPVLALVMARFGWRAVFLVTGAAGLAWCALWYALCREPQDRAVERAPGQPPLQWAQLKAILGSRDMWGVFLGHTCGTVTLWFLLTWFPTYLVTYRGMSFMRMGVWASAPYLAAFAGSLISGFLSDWLLRRGASLAAARKAPVVAGALLSMCIVGANYVERPAAVMLFMTVAAFGHGFASLGWAFVSTMAPEGLIGLVGGIYNFVGNFSAIFVPIVVGYLVRGGRFEPALVFISACAAAGALSFLFLVRKVERLRL